MAACVLLHAAALLPSGFVATGVRISGPVAAAAQQQPRLWRHVAPRLDLPNIDGTGAFRSVQEYPCDLDIKVIGNNEGPFVTDMLTLCAEITEQQEEDVGVRWRDNGKYRAITLRLHFENADQVRARAADFFRPRWPVACGHLLLSCLLPLFTPSLLTELCCACMSVGRRCMRCMRPSTGIRE